MTSIALFWVLLQCFQIVGHKQIFFLVLTDYASPSPSLQSLPHTRNSYSEHCTKLLITESSQASPHTCPCILANPSLSLTLFKHLILPLSSMHHSVPQALFLSNRREAIKLLSHPGWTLLMSQGPKQECQQWPWTSTGQVMAGCTTGLWNKLTHCLFS